MADEELKALIRKVAREEILDHFGKYLEVTGDGLVKLKTEPRPTPPSHDPEQGRCEECGGQNGAHRSIPDGHGERIKCPWAPAKSGAQPAEAKGAPEQIDAAWHPFTLIPTVVPDGSPVGEGWTRYTFVRLDVHERKVAEAVAEADEKYELLRVHAGAKPNESTADALARVVAERDAAVAMAEALEGQLAGARQVASEEYGKFTDATHRAESAEIRVKILEDLQALDTARIRALEAELAEAKAELTTVYRTANETIARIAALKVKP